MILLKDIIRKIVLLIFISDLILRKVCLSLYSIISIIMNYSVAQMMGHTNVDMLIHKYNKFIPAEVRKIDKSIGLF